VKDELYELLISVLSRSERSATSHCLFGCGEKVQLVVWREQQDWQCTCN